MIYDIPELDINLCADRLIPPVTKWGTRRRDAPMPGTWHFYCNDYVFTHLLKRPELVPATGCVVATEPNFSVCDQTPAVEALWWTYQKRRIARVWQSHGVRILVDLNVGARHRATNLLGVPPGWTAYVTRVHKGVAFEAIHDEFRLAADHAGTEAILFVVVGGGRRRTGRYCRANGWPWVPEHWQVLSGVDRPYGQG